MLDQFPFRPQHVPLPSYVGPLQCLILKPVTRYMSLPFHLAELVQKIQGDITARKENLRQAQGLYEKFLKLLDSYDALAKSDARLFEAYLEDRTGFSTTSTNDAAARRDAKIKRFREEKELKKKLEVC